MASALICDRCSKYMSTDDRVDLPLTLPSFSANGDGPHEFIIMVKSGEITTPDYCEECMGKMLEWTAADYNLGLPSRQCAQTKGKGRKANAKTTTKKPSA